jgi:hypothetical protein
MAMTKGICLCALLSVAILVAPAAQARAALDQNPSRPKLNLTIAQMDFVALPHTDYAKISADLAALSNPDNRPLLDLIKFETVSSNRTKEFSIIADAKIAY